MKRDRYDSDDVAEELRKANEKLDALTNEAMRRVEDDNSKKKRYAFKALGGGIATGAATAVAAVATGVVETATVPIFVAAATVSSGYLLKRKLDTLWNADILKKRKRTNERT